MRFFLAILATLIGQFTDVASEQIQVMPVARTPEANKVSLVVSFPKEGQILSGNRVWVQFRIDGYALGAGSQFDRAKEVANTKLGQTVHVIIDDHSYFPVNEPAVNPFDQSTYFYDTSYKFEIPYKLKEGGHTIRIFPARSYGEGLKGDRTFFATYFYVGKEGGDVQEVLSKPYLTYNEPGEHMALQADQPVLLDFYLSNCELTPDGYKVILTIDGKISRTLTTWQPYYIYGLKKGKHTIRLQLVDRNSNPVSGPYNDVQRSIHVN